MNSEAISLMAADALRIPDSARGREGLVRTVKHERTCKTCLHCEKQLPMMVRALSKPPFCTPAHEREYRVHMEGLMTERLRAAAARIRMAMANPESG